MARFGESQGFERNHVRDKAWRDRDWVIQAFNRDLPYDEFVRRQIAGDVLYPDNLSALIATGYHECGTWDQVAHLEGSSEMQKATRFDEMEDLVAALGQTFLGLTINCARCHDYKFDPISQKKYYQVAAHVNHRQATSGVRRAGARRLPQAVRGKLSQGRDHQPQGFTNVFAGAGLTKGFAHGVTDAVGYTSVVDPVTPYDLHATVLHLLGIDHKRLTFYHDGIERRLTNVHGSVVTALLA